MICGLFDVLERKVSASVCESEINYHTKGDDGKGYHPYYVGV